MNTIYQSSAIFINIECFQRSDIDLLSAVLLSTEYYSIYHLFMKLLTFNSLNEDDKVTLSIPSQNSISLTFLGNFICKIFQTEIVKKTRNTNLHGIA